MAQAETQGTVSNEAHEMLNMFWQRSLEEIRKLEGNDFKNHELPLARIKKIMKLDEEVKMISAEAPVLFSKAAEIFISELSLRAWIHTEENKRRTLQRNDIAMAITKYDQFDFLIDIVPREEIKTSSKRADEVQRTPVMADQVQYYFQLAQQAALQSQNAQTPTTQSQATIVQQAQPQQQVLQLGGTNIPAITIQPQTIGDTGATQQQSQPQLIQVQLPQGTTTASAQQVQVTAQPTQETHVTQAQTTQHVQAAGGTTQVFQQVLTPSGEVQNVPIQLTPAQIQALHLQLQGKQPGQPILVQTTPSQGSSQTEAATVDQAQEQAQYSTQPLFQVPLNIGGQQVYIQQAGDSVQAVDVQDS